MIWYDMIWYDMILWISDIFTNSQAYFKCEVKSSHFDASFPVSQTRAKCLSVCTKDPKQPSLDWAQENWWQRISLTWYDTFCSGRTLIRFEFQATQLLWFWERQFQDCGPQGQCPSLAPWLSLVMAHTRELSWSHHRAIMKRYDKQIS